MPWKNGGGVTAEVASEGVSPPGWRLSIATIAADGPFSDFSGYDRTVVAIEGAGVELRLEGGERVVLDSLYEPFTFAGERKVESRLIAGAVRDFNVMTQRARFRHTVDVRRIPGDTEVTFGGDGLTFALVLRGSLGEAASGDTVRVDGESVTLPARAESVVCVVRIRSVTPL